jgi:hypothetical protein
VKKVEAEELLQPLRRPGAPWTRELLGEWEVDGTRQGLECFVFTGPAGGGSTVHVGIFARL